ncbi:MAG TPA: hypothetical protein VKD28_07460 [Gemmatimonadales bacterium]|nr:hypothetical protein [Gemmatimonadales bacterium]
MKWPWVTRETYEEQLRRADRAEAAMQSAVRLADQSTSILNALIARLDRSLPPAPPEGQARNPLPLATPERNDVTEAIELASGNDRGLARHLTRWAKQQALDGMKEREIIQSILHWPRATEWDGEPDDVPEPLW